MTVPLVIILSSSESTLKNGVGCPGGCPDFFILQQILIDKNRQRCWWPTGGTPPMAKPVISRTNSGSAIFTGSARFAARCTFSLARLAPLATTRTGCGTVCFQKSAILRSAPLHTRPPGRHLLRFGWCPASGQLHRSGPGLAALPELF